MAQRFSSLYRERTGFLCLRLPDRQPSFFGACRTDYRHGDLLPHDVPVWSGDAHPDAPEGLRRISDFLPLTYVVRLIQGLWFDDALKTVWLPVLVLVGTLIVGSVWQLDFSDGSRIKLTRLTSVPEMKSMATKTIQSKPDHQRPSTRRDA